MQKIERYEEIQDNKDILKYTERKSFGMALPTILLCGIFTYLSYYNYNGYDNRFFSFL